MYLSAVRFDDMSGKSQAQTGPGNMLIFRGNHAIEAVKDTGLILRRNANAAVRYLNSRLPIFVVQSQANPA
jgi:hypothetical protein